MRRLLALLVLLPLNLYAQGAGTPPYRGLNNWSLIFGTDNVFDIGATSSQRPRTGYFGTSVITPALTVSGLTSGRVPFASTGGLLADDADMTFANDTLTVTKATVGTLLTIPVGTSASTGTLFANDTDTWIGSAGAGNMSFYTNGVERYRFDSGGRILATTSFSLGAVGGGGVVLGQLSTNVGRISSSVAETSYRYLMGGGASVASGSALPAPTGSLFHVTGTTGITSITSTNFGTGVCITIIFDGSLTVTDGSNLKMAGDFSATADDTLGLCYDGTNWYETHRSVN